MTIGSLACSLVLRCLNCESAAEGTFGGVQSSSARYEAAHCKSWKRCPGSLANSNQDLLSAAIATGAELAEPILGCSSESVVCGIRESGVRYIKREPAVQV